MKAAIRLLVLIVLVLVFLLILADVAVAQPTYNVIYSFQGKTDAGWPGGGLTLDSQGNLYGTTTNFGPHGYGAVFKLTPTGSGWAESVIYGFCHNRPRCTDGAYPLGSVAFGPDGNLYGTTSYGGSAQGWGTVYQLAPNGDGTFDQTVLYHLSGKLGDSYPAAGLIINQQGRMFGTAEGNPVTASQGEVFEVAPTPGGGWQRRILYTFRGSSDGSKPSTALVMDKRNCLYGMTISGGSIGSGVVFQLVPHPDGTWDEKVILDLPAVLGPTTGGLTIDDFGNLYGTADGMIFELSPSASGWQETILYVFGVNEGGRLSHLVFDKAGNLYGTAGDGGQGSCANGYGCGSVFKLTKTAHGWKKSTLHSFNGGPGGGDPIGGVVLDNAGNIYGVTEYGGDRTNCTSIGCGVVYQITP